MDRKSIVQSFQAIKVWKRKGVSAPHKPLLILYALGKLLRGESRLIPFSEVDEVLGGLLKEFGPKDSRQGTIIPFWRLQNDGIWEIPAAHKVRENSRGDAVRSDLFHYNVTGGIRKSIARRIRKDSALMCEIISNVLETHFSSQDHVRVLKAVGIEPTLWKELELGNSAPSRVGAEAKREEHQQLELLSPTSMRENAKEFGDEELIAQLSTRFPLLSKLSGQFGNDLPCEGIPWFFALLMSAATSHDRGACCFVLNTTLGTTATAAALLALTKIQGEFPTLVEEYARAALHIGQHVRVKPSNYVYEYGGLWEEYPGLFKLKILGERLDNRSFPMKDLLRLEPTDRLRPKGKNRSDLGTFERSHLDKLLDLDSCGNNSLFRNTVLIHMARSRFSRASDEICLTAKDFEVLETLSESLPWGSIGPNGELKSNDAYQVTGEPIIAATRVPEDLAIASTVAEAGTKIVLADGARGLARDLQAFDDIADRQRLVILASPEEVEALEILKDHDCPIWHMSPEEVLIGEHSAEQRERISLVGATIRAADTRRRMSVEVVDCHHEVLQSVAEKLGRAATLVADNDELDEADEIFAILYSILLECGECCFGAEVETKARLSSARELIARNGRWLPRDFTVEIDGAIGGLAKALSGKFSGQGKADALLRTIPNENYQDWAVATRSPRTAEILDRNLNQHGLDMLVLPVSTISPDSEFAGVVLPAWPNGQKFTRLKNMAVTSDIRILAYPFEVQWVSRHQSREITRERSNQMDAKTRSSILGIEPRFLSPKTSHRSNLPIQDTRSDLPIFSFVDRVEERKIRRPAAAGEGEESREAQLIQFFGDCYTLLTEWAELPRLNNLIDSANVDDAGLEHVKISQLVPGDYVLFRASEDKEFIRQIAEDNLGLEEYEKIRSIAERWRSSLRRLGISPSEVQHLLDSFDLKRNPATIAGWLHSPYRIGPGNFKDIEVIARAGKDTELFSRRKEVIRAISHIRRAHIAAGKQLTQLILGELSGHLSNLDDQPVLLDLNYGEAWVVQVDKIDFERRNYPANSVNRLLWADDVTS